MFITQVMIYNLATEPTTMNKRFVSETQAIFGEKYFL